VDLEVKNGQKSKRVGRKSQHVIEDSLGIPLQAHVFLGVCGGFCFKESSNEWSLEESCDFIRGAGGSPPFDPTDKIFMVTLCIRFSLTNSLSRMSRG